MAPLPRGPSARPQGRAPQECSCCVASLHGQDQERAILQVVARDCAFRLQLLLASQQHILVVILHKAKDLTCVSDNLPDLAVPGKDWTARSIRRFLETPQSPRCLYEQMQTVMPLVFRLMCLIGCHIVHCNHKLTP